MPYQIGALRKWGTEHIMKVYIRFLYE